MTTNPRSWRGLFVAGGALALLLAGYALSPDGGGKAAASPLEKVRAWHAAKKAGPCCEGPGLADDFEGQWYWLRSPEQEKRVVASLYNRYCIRCHGVDGRGVWDIPDVPDFTNARWQAMRTDGQLARSILEGRGAVMPPFRGALTLEESYAVARHLRSFVPGTEVSRPEVGTPAAPQHLAR